MKNSIQNVALLLLVFVSNLAYGQKNIEDVIYLKNGGIMRGKIIENIPNETVKIQTKDRNVFVYKSDEIGEIIEEIKPNGYINLTEFGFSINSNATNHNSIEDYHNFDGSFSFKTINGYKFNNHLSLGLGIGVDYFSDVAFIPITFDARLTIFKGKVSPVLIANFGYSINKFNYYLKLPGNFICNPQIGLKCRLSKRVAFLFNVGYKFQAIDYTKGHYPNITTKSTFFNFMTYSIGLAF